MMLNEKKFMTLICIVGKVVYDENNEKHISAYMKYNYKNFHYFHRDNYFDCRLKEQVIFNLSLCVVKRKIRKFFGSNRFKT